MKQENLPDVMNSRNERLILELPSYTYCHSSQTKDDNQPFFLGRQSLLLKMKNLFSTASSKTGVYLVAGNRGVGKSRLVEEVIKESSLQKYSITYYFSFLFVALILTLGVQYATNNELWEKFANYENWFIAGKILLALILLSVIGHFSSIRIRTGQYEKLTNNKKRIIFFNGLLHTTEAALKECFILPSKSNPFLRTQNVLMVILLILIIDIFAFYSSYTHLQLFVIYICAVLGFYYHIHSKRILIKAYQKKESSIFKNWKNDDTTTTLTEAFNKDSKWAAFFVIVFSIASVALTIKNQCGIYLFLGILIIIGIVFGIHYRIVNKTLKKDENSNFMKFLWDYLRAQIGPLFNSIDHYIKNSSHVYLKINFGHDVLNELDILRLITRTLTAEYKKFRKSLMQTLFWRVLAFSLLMSTSYLFYKNIYIQDIRPFLDSKCFYNKSSQHFFSRVDKKDDFLSDYLNNKKNNSIDKAINRIYYYLLNTPGYFWSKKTGENYDSFYKINYGKNPVNYAWCIIFLLFYFFGCLLLRFNFFTSHYTIKKQLNQLNENITYSVEREYNLNAVAEREKLKANIGIKKKKTRLIADAREIEKELQDILENIQKIPIIFARPDFVIVFDELDKVSPETLTTIQESGVKHKEKLFSANTATERQAVILKLLSNLKYFLSNANAKFIFIAGREMYDMYLADIADRNNYFGSIFNDVFFVPSLLTDVKNNKKQYDITTLVEEYVCRHLIPDDYPVIAYNLKEYNNYLENYIYTNSGIFNTQVEMKRQKIISTLQQFIIYLAHTSKGAPKKMVQVFESFIGSYDRQELKSRQLVVKRFRNSLLYLNLDYYAQYTIGMTSYMMSPVFKRLSDANIQEHSDKLFVSTLHFVDYLMKFHGHNFSWRSIDISPEVIEINRSPVLKSIVNDVVTLFEQIHFHKPVMGLFEFKFDALLAQEIYFLSKMDERFSAQFNFSLDESLILKEYYKELLKEKQSEYEKYQTYGEKYVSSIASLQIVLGDLYFFDDELDIAALYYKDGIHLLHKQLAKDKEKINLEIFYLFIRNQLKLAFLYEKRKQHDFAYLIYGDLTSLLVQYRNFDLEKKGISIRKDGNDYLMVRYFGNEQTDPYFKNIETLKYSPVRDACIYECDIDQQIGDTEEALIKRKEKAKFRPMRFDQLSPVTQQIMFKNMTFEGLQLMYMPLLAKLQILEKSSLIGILKKDIDLIELEFEFLTRSINYSEVKILSSDFYSKIGDILFYKNKVFSSPQKTSMKKMKIEISHYPCFYYQKALFSLIVDSNNEKSDIESFKKQSILKSLKDKSDFLESKFSSRYCMMMAKVLSNLGDTYFQSQERQCEFCDLKNTNCNTNNVQFKIASSSCAPQNNDFWDNWANYIISNEIDYPLSKFINDICGENLSGELSNIELALLSYSLSMKYYKKANQYKHYAFQVEKILNCLKNCLQHNIYIKEICSFCKWDKNNNKYVNLEMLVSKSIRALYNSYDNINMLEINKRKADFDKLEQHYNKRDVPLHYIQVDSEVSRIRIIAKELELELAKVVNSANEVVKKLFKNFITSPYHSNYSVSARVHRLRVKVNLNMEAYEIIRNECYNYFKGLQHPANRRRKIEQDYNNNMYIQTLAIINCSLYEKNDLWDKSDIKKIFSDTDCDDLKYNYLSVLEMLIADSIFCLDEILRLIKTAGDSYLFNHSFFASIYDRLSIWTYRYEILQLIKNYHIVKNSGDKDVEILPKSFRYAINYFQINMPDGETKIIYFKNNEKGKEKEKYEVKEKEKYEVKEKEKEKEKYKAKEKEKEFFDNMQLDIYLKKQLGVDFREQLSSHYYSEQALAHYHKTIDTHNGGRAYLNLLEQMYFIKGDYDDVTSHFNVALERFKVNNSNDIQDKVKKLKSKGIYSTVYDLNKYFENVSNKSL